MENTLIGLTAWNFAITTQLKSMLYVTTNNGVIPTQKVNQKVNLAMEMLEEFEQLKQGTIIAQLVKHARVCKLEAESIRWWMFWKRDRLRLLWTSYSVYQNAMAIILDTLPTDTQALMQQQPPPATDESSSAPSEPGPDSPLKIV